MALDPARWERLTTLFHEALSRPGPDRRGYIEANCSGDPDLLAEALALLEADAAPAPLLDADRAELAAAVLDGSVPIVPKIGAYRVVRVLGRGGMGVVYLAEREDLGVRAAIKVLRDASLSPARRARFQAEQRTLARLAHPGIARIHDADSLPDGTPYFVMEYVEGIPITTYCHERALSIPDRLRLFRRVCTAVQHAHRHAVIHRDLKPSNVMVVTDGRAESPAVKLLDFGIAKQLAELDSPAAQTQFELRMMTPAYAAPEQILGDPVALNTDVYALGVLLYEMLTGTHPYDQGGLTAGQVEARILAGEPDRPSARAGAGTGPASRRAGAVGKRGWAELDALCLTAMHRDPERRYGTVEALIRDLDHYERGEPLEARPDGVAYRLGKFLRRNRRPLAAAALVATTVVGLSAFYADRLAVERDRARVEAEKAERISGFLLGLFEASDPFAEVPDELTVRALLERGERQAAELADQPVVQASMLNVLGRVYVRLSEYERAESPLSRALELRREHGSPVDVAETLSELGVLHRFRGDLESAEAALREALAIRQRHLPAPHPDLAANLDNLGVVLNNGGHYQEAESLYRLALRIGREAHGELHASIGHTLNNLAVNQLDQGRYEAAERYAREALAVSVATYGPDHPLTAVDLANLGVMLETRGEFAAADSMLSESVRITRARLGDEHYQTVFRLTQLGGMLRRKGDLDRAESVLREAHATAERILGPAHRDVGVALNHLALTLQAREEYDEAEPLLRRALDVFAASLGEDHPFTAIVGCNLGHLLHLAGRPLEGEPFFVHGLAVLRNALPPTHDMVASNESMYGALLTSLGRYDDAGPLLRGAHASLLEAFGPDHGDTRRAAERLAALDAARVAADRVTADRPAAVQ